MSIDSTCLLWSRVCGERGACMLYDNVSYRHIYVSIAIALKTSAFLLYTTTWHCLRRNYRKYIPHGEGRLTPTVTLDHLGEEMSREPNSQTQFIYSLEEQSSAHNMESVL